MFMQFTRLKMPCQTVNVRWCMHYAGKWVWHPRVQGKWSLLFLHLILTTVMNATFKLKESYLLLDIHLCISYKECVLPIFRFSLS